MVIAETKSFTARIGDLLDDEDYRALQLELVSDRLPGASFLAQAVCESSVGLWQDAASEEERG